MALRDAEVTPELPASQLLRSSSSLLSLSVGLETLLGVTLEVGYVETVRGQTVDTSEKVPSHGEGTFLMGQRIRWNYPP